MHKFTSSHNLQLITFSTALSYEEVRSRLDVEIGKGSPNLHWHRAGSLSTGEFEDRVRSTLGPSGFRLFNEFDHGEWFRVYSPSGTSSGACLYVIGNPLIARTVLPYDMRAGLNVPVRLLVLANDKTKGTDVIYHLPSSLIALNDNPKLTAAARILDDKLESLVKRITQASARL